MSDQNRFAAFVRAAMVCFGAALVVAIVPAAAGAATPTPVSFTNCGGTVSHDAKGSAADEPNLLAYRFRCNGNISAYTVIVGQNGDAGGSVDDFSPSPSVLESDGVTPSPTESLTCEGTTPSDGFNCNAGAAGVLTAGNFAEGTVDPVQAYCKHFPAKAKPGTPAVAQARVWLVVTDSTGAQDGPFTLRSTSRCPKVPNVFPASKKGKHKSTRRHGRRTHAAR